MKIFAILALLAFSAAGAVALQEMPEPAQPSEHHAWLQQLVGEWTASSEASMEPDTEPIRMESTESVRSIGGLWVMAEGKADFAGMPFTSILTLGYDERAEAFVGTWIDSMQSTMYSYRGTLDPARKALTLETRGPSFDDPAETSIYRDVITLESEDHKTLTSSVQNEDGSWDTFLRADYHRKKG